MLQKTQKKGIYTKIEKVSINRQIVSLKAISNLKGAVPEVKKR